jgi:hypothetical protein
MICLPSQTFQSMDELLLVVDASVLLLPHHTPSCCCRFKDRLVDEGFNPAYGARPLRRAIQRLLEDALAERMLGGDISEGDTVIMDVDAESNITVLNGDKTFVTTVSTGDSGIS